MNTLQNIVVPLLECVPIILHWIERIARAHIVGFLFLRLNTAYAHIGPKEVRRISFPAQLDQSPWIVIKNLGVFLGENSGLRWTCDESLSVLGGMNDAAIVGTDVRTWLVGDAQGLHRSLDDGCHFDPVGPPFDVHVVGRILVSQSTPDDVIVTTETLGEPNDIY